MSNNQASLSETKEILRSLIISSPMAITVRELSKDFLKSEGFPIPYGKLGYANLDLFLRSLTDTLYLDVNGNVRAVQSSKSQHIDQMVAKQKSATRDRKRVGNDVRPNDNRGITQNNNSINNRPPLYSRQPPMPYSGQPQSFGQWNYTTTLSPYGQVPNYYHLNSPNAMQRIQQLQYPIHLPPNIQRNILTQQQFILNQQQQQYQNNLAHNRINFNTQRQHQNNQTKPAAPVNHKVPEVYEVSSSSTENTSGVQKFESNEIKVTKPTAEEQINRAMEELKLKRKSTTTQSVQQVNYNQTDDNDALPLLEDDDPIFSVQIPKCSLNYGKKIERAELPANMKPGATIKIFITEIHNPHKFWFHVDERAEILDNLMKDLRIYYSTLQPDELRIARCNIKRGQLCVALFLNIWHRGEIVNDEIDDNQVKVFFMDYGTTAKVEIKNVKYLSNAFVQVPSQVYRGSLANIRPLNSHRWNRDATYTMLVMVMDIILHAKITEINYNERTVTMLLIDTNNELDLHINNALIHKGHATSESRSSSQANETNKKRFYKLYPTFEMLEKGKYPSFYEIGVLLSKGIDIYEYEDTTVIPGIDKNVMGNVQEVSSTLNPLSTSFVPQKL